MQSVKKGCQSISVVSAWMMVDCFTKTNEQVILHFVFDPLFSIYVFQLQKDRLHLDYEEFKHPHNAALSLWPSSINLLLCFHSTPGYIEYEQRPFSTCFMRLIIQIFSCLQKHIATIKRDFKAPQNVDHLGLNKHH